MILRRIYQVIAAALAALAVVLLVGGFINGGYIVGVSSALFTASIAFFCWQFASGPEGDGRSFVGIDQKAKQEKADTLARKAKKA
jgi:hypothetical protein